MLYINAGIYFLMALMIFPRNPPGRSPGVSPVAQQQQLAEGLKSLASRHITRALRLSQPSSTLNVQWNMHMTRPSLVGTNEACPGP